MRLFFFPSRVALKRIDVDVSAGLAGQDGIASRRVVAFRKLGRSEAVEYRAVDCVPAGDGDGVMQITMLYLVANMHSICVSLPSTAKKCCKT